MKDSYETMTSAGARPRNAVEQATAINRKLEERAIKTGKTNLVRVVAVRRGYDNQQLRYEGARFQIRTGGRDEPLPEWVVPEAEWDERFAAMVPEDYEGDASKDEVLREECAAALWREREESADAAWRAERLRATAGK